MSAVARRPPDVFRGIVYMVLAGASFALLDSVAKWLSARYPMLMVAWSRYFFHVLILAAVMLPRMGRRLVATRHPWLQLVRGLFLGSTTLAFFSAIQRLPIAEATAIVAIAPLLVTAVAVLWLGERAPPGTWWALAISFGGVLLIIRPGGALFGWAALLPLLSAVCVSGYQLLTRRLAGIDDGVSTLFLGGVVAAAMMTALVPLHWTAPASFLDGFLLVALGGVGAGGHLMLVRAYENASASTLAPYGYAHAVTALPMGLLVFGAFPDAIALAGMALILATGAWMAIRRHMRVDPVED